MLGQVENEFLARGVFRPMPFDYLSDLILILIFGDFPRVTILERISFWIGFMLGARSLQYLR